MIGAVIFAWDSVLVETEPACFQVAREVLAEVCTREGLRVSPQAIEEAVTATSGRSGQEAFEVCASRLGIQASPAAMAETWTVRLEGPYLATPLIPGARDIVMRLMPHCQVATASVAPARLVEALLERHDMARLFNTVVTLDDGSVEPARRYLEAARRLQVEPASCIVVEGTVPGVRAARDVDMRCIAIPRRARHGGDYLAANRIVRSLADLTLEFLNDVDRPHDAEAGRPAAIYARCHAHARADDLLHLQVGAATTLAQDRGWRVVASFEDVASDDDWRQRQGLQQIMRLAHAREIQHVVVTEPSVLATGAFHQAEIINELARHDVRVHTVFRRSPMSGASL